MRVLVWIAEGTWPASIDAARRFAPADSEIVLLHVTSQDIFAATDGASAGLLGRGRRGRDPTREVEELAAVSSAELLAAAADRLQRPAQLVERRGRVEREVATVAGAADLLILARDGQRDRPGPKSLGKAARFVVDHAACPVMLVWPSGAPTDRSLPPPPPRHPHDD